MVAPAGEYFQKLAGHIATLEPIISEKTRLRKRRRVR